MGAYKKFSAAEVILGSLFTLFIDVISAFLDLLVIGLFISPVIQGGTTAALWLWFRSKGGKSTQKPGRWLAKGALSFAPWIPTTFFVFIASAYFHNRAS